MNDGIRPELEAVVAELVDLPMPGGGDTSGRLRRLADVARTHDQSVVRLAEAHVDAVAIAAEAGHELRPGELYGVWASRGDLRRDRDTGAITGTKPFCSGASVVDRALVTAASDDGSILLDVAASSAVAVQGQWRTPACAATATVSLTWAGHPVDARDVVAADGWYLDRVGFWQGACSPAATWAGAAEALVDHARRVVSDGNLHGLALLGSMVANDFALTASLAEAGRLIDESPHDVGVARSTALSLRHVVERTATAILDDFGRCLGPRPFVADARIAQLASDLHLLLRQYHGPDDDHLLGQVSVVRTAKPGKR